MVATRDIGDVAAAALLDDVWRRHRVRGVTARRRLARRGGAAFSAALGRTVRYVQVPDAAMREGLLGAGASAHVADEYPRLMARLGTLDYVAEPRTAETTTPDHGRRVGPPGARPSGRGVAAAPAAA
jgi:hypothetical protein